MGTSIYWHILVNPEPSEGLKIRRGAIIIKGGFFFRKCNVFFRSPNLKKKNIPKNYPELEI